MRTLVPGLIAGTAVAMLVVAACGGPAPSASRGVPAAASSGASSPQIAVPMESTMPAEPSSRPASPDPSAAANGPAELPPGELAAGTYRNSQFSPPVTFAVDEGWTSTIFTGFFDVQRRRGTPEVIAVQFARVVGVVDALGSAAAVPTGAADAARTVTANPGLEVLGESEAQVGGLTGRVVEVRNTSGAHVQILDLPPGRLGIDSERALWIAFLDTDEGILAIMVGGPSEGWEEALAIAEPVLESVVVEP